ncbi:MAG TPA: hypothetical protein DE315_05250 [Candidatus Omnitrophica bacterium]|nr:MAG: hypothetical protein A2Y05_01225 [Omnitrophica WOR_2 bacterium GWA2_53_43]HCI44918.1 hypothetical protein [Candidatus Omnitrophota bacterium]
MNSSFLYDGSMREAGRLMTVKVLAGVCSFALLSAPCAFANVVINFHGRIDLVQKQFDVTLDFPGNFADAAPGKLEDKRPSVAISGVKLSDKDYRFSLTIDHLRTPVFDLLSRVESSVEVDPRPPDESAPAVRGEIWSRNSLVDYKPIHELTGQFEIKDSQLVLKSVSLGNLSCDGSLDLVYPYKMDMKVLLHDVAMEDFLNFWVRGKDYKSFGAVSGEIGVSGTWDRIGLRGSLESHDGYVEELEYNSIHLNAKGVYPRLNIGQSTISKADGLSFTFSGPVDLSDQENFRKQIGALVLAPLVSGSASEREWTIKRLDQPNSGSTKIKYLLRKDDKLNESSGMIGVEQTMNF